MRTYARYLLAVPTFAAGWYFFFVSVHLLLGSEAGITRVLIGGCGGMLAVLISGYIMAPLLAEQIADSVMEKIQPLLGMLPGGRRRTDPPADGDA